jgi:predicted NAD-dependent protein-ADP-ribosyltransferase YbiA (DUF1768 family)
MRKEGDFSFIRKGLFKKVMVGDEPLVHPDRKGNPQYIYKMINAWGDSFRANELYDSARKSVVENGYIKVDKEVDDLTIAAYFETPSSVVTQPTTSFVQQAPAAASSEKINIYAGTGENADLSNFASRPFTLKDSDISFDMGDNFKRDFYSVEQAFQYIKSIVAGDPFEGSNEITEKIAKETNGAKLKKLGSGNSLTTFPKGLKEWDGMSKTIMYELLLASFKQNPQALQNLLATEKAELTHKYMGVEQDEGRFSKLLMEVREELESIKDVSNKDVVNALNETNTIEKNCNKS